MAVKQVLRGSCWLDTRGLVRSAIRGGSMATNRYKIFGFRLIVTLDKDCVMRGGSWYSQARPSGCAFRHRHDLVFRDDVLGFRLTVNSI